MDMRRRVLAARLAIRMDKNKEYSKEIGLSDRSGFIENPKGGVKNVSGDIVSSVCSNSVL